MYKALYRKWRPKSFDDVIGQQHITEVLKNEVVSGRISHAYLFVGSRGIGKTSCARILSRAVNCKSPINGNPCENCEVCKNTELENELDIVEIDAASNNGVENIREMREELVYTPTKCKYRVYIVDEVHMLSTGAFNAFLKTLEEPPEHVIFVLATTEFHKLPATIVSRCQKFIFHRVSDEDICARIKYICEQEKINIEDSAAMVIARAADGGVRDALSVLDQCFNISSTNKNNLISKELVQNILGISSGHIISELLNLVFSGNSMESLNFLDEIHKKSPVQNLLKLCEEIVKYFRDIMVKIVSKDKNVNQNLKLENILNSLEILQEAHKDMNFGTDKKISLEIAIIKLCQLFSDNTTNICAQKNISETVTGNDTCKEKNSADNIKIDISMANNLIEWTEILEEVHKDNTLKSLYMSLRDSQAFKSNNYILIKSENSMAFELLRKVEHRNNLKKIIHKVLGKPYNIGPYNSSNISQVSNGDNILDSLIEKARVNNILINQEDF